MILRHWRHSHERMRELVDENFSDEIHIGCWGVACFCFDLLKTESNDWDRMPENRCVMHVEAQKIATG